MPKIMADPLPDGCPWSGWTPPNVDWCEEELCSWIVNPADTWSNLAYLVVGVVMWRRALRGDQERLAIFGPAGILVAVFSFVYHASYTYFLQFFDFVGMFVFGFVMITANALRLGWISAARQWWFFGLGVLGASALVPLVSQTAVPIQSLVVVLIVVMLGQELAIHRHADPAAKATDYRAYFVALALLTVAATFSLLDVTRIWCAPQNHWIQGHALWHLFSAASLYALFCFYAGLPEQPPGGQPCLPERKGPVTS
jgi:hypothetical protein